MPLIASMSFAAGYPPKKRLWCLMVIGLYGLLTALAYSPVLHRHVHAEAGQAGHHCALTEMSEGGLLSLPVLPVCLSQSVAPIEKLPFSFCPGIPTLESPYTLPGRAPPRIESPVSS